MGGLRAEQLERSFSADLPLFGAVATRTIFTAGQPTTWGSLAFKDFVDRTDVHVQRLIDAGAVVVGKPICPSLRLAANGNALHGVTRNPEPRFQCGAAVAVAALAGDMVVLADLPDLGLHPNAGGFHEHGLDRPPVVRF